MQAKYKWLLVPPALALALFLGPLRDAGGPAEPGAPAAQQPPKDSRTPKVPTPQLPGFGQVASALIGVLLLGVAGLAAFKKLRSQGGPSGGTLITVRQSVRLSPRQQLHAVQWHERLLLIGEGEHGLVVLREADDPNALEDEASVRGREDDADEGAVPRDMIIPRPPTRSAAATPPKPAAQPAAVQAATKAMADFRSLLRKAREGQTVS